MTLYSALTLVLGSVNVLVFAAALRAYQTQARELMEQSQLLRTTSRAAVEQTAALASQTELLTRQTAALIQQAEHANHTNRVAASQTVNGAMHAINKVFLDHPELHSCFYGPAPLPTAKDTRTRALIVADMLLDLISMTFDLEQNDVIDGGVAQGWREFFSSIARQSQPLHEWWCETRGWWEPAVREFMEEAYRAGPPGMAKELDGERRPQEPSH